MAANTLNEWSDGEDDFVWQIDENVWEWNNSEDDDLIRNINENDLIRDSDLQNEPIQTGRGEKRKSDEPLLPENDFYHMESVKKHNSKKFRMTATYHVVRFNNVLREVDLLESHERTRAIFEHLLNDVTPRYG